MVYVPDGVPGTGVGGAGVVPEPPPPHAANASNKQHAIADSVELNRGRFRTTIPTKPSDPMSQIARYLVPDAGADIAKEAALVVIVKVAEAGADEDGVTGEVTVQVALLGHPEAARATAEPNPPSDATDNVPVDVLPALIVSLFFAPKSSVKSGFAVTWKEVVD